MKIYLAYVFGIATAVGMGCASGPRHLATQIEHGATTGIGVLQASEMDLYAKGQIDVATHKALEAKIKTAADLNEQAVKITLGTTAASPDYAALIGQALALVQEVLAALPSGPQKNAAARAVAGGL